VPRVTAEPLLQADRLTRRFGNLTAVNAVDLAVRPGELRSIIGPNGAGKSTLFKLISGELAPTSGRVRFAGEDITGRPQFEVSRRGIAKSYQITTIFPKLTVFENVRLAAQCRRTILDCWTPADRVAGVAARAHEILALVELQGKAGEPAATIGHGLQRHLEIAIALACEPRLLLLDEPTAGMSPSETAETVDLVRSLTPGVTVLMVEHKMNVVLGMADRITVLHYGRKLFEGSPEEVSAHPKVQEVYLSGSL
jgi:branched-chain amino acid transport system ATP-binding protein